MIILAAFVAAFFEVLNHADDYSCCCRATRILGVALAPRAGDCCLGICSHPDLFGHAEMRTGDPYGAGRRSDPFNSLCHRVESLDVVAVLPSHSGATGRDGGWQEDPDRQGLSRGRSDRGHCNQRSEPNSGQAAQVQVGMRRQIV